jgi:hypothetical protein
MQSYRTLLLPMLVGVAIIVAGAMAQQTSPPNQPSKSPADAKAASGQAGKTSADIPPPPKPPQADPAATKVLDNAVNAKRFDWVQTTFWEQVDVQGLSFQAQGTYLSAPGNRLHLDLQVHIGGTVGRLEIVSDGTTLYEADKIGDGERTITKVVELKKVLETLNIPDMSKEVSDEFFQSQAFYGVIPLLKSIQQRMTVTKKENLRWHGHEVVQLTAEWSGAVAKEFTQDGKQQWPPFVPRQCRLFLDAKTLWPHRLEWWGPARPGADNSLLVQMEFRNPNHEPLDEARCKKEFTFEAVPAEVSSRVDRTEEIKAAIKHRNQQLASQKGKAK